MNYHTSIGLAQKYSILNFELALDPGSKLDLKRTFQKFKESLKKFTDFREHSHCLPHKIHPNYYFKDR